MLQEKSQDQPFLTQLNRGDQGYKKIDVELERNKRSATLIGNSLMPAVIILEAINLALLFVSVSLATHCIATKLSASRKARYQIYDSIRTHLIRQDEMITKLTRDVITDKKLQSPYPIMLQNGEVESDFAIMNQILHWNVGWTNENNETLKASTQILCPSDLPKPMTTEEWTKISRIFTRESGMPIVTPQDIEHTKSAYEISLNLDNLQKEQLCQTPICVIPNYEWDGKDCKCHYCGRVCCNCENCCSYRAFFKIRTALINSAKVNMWDQNTLKIMREIRRHEDQNDHDTK